MVKGLKKSNLVFMNKKRYKLKILVFMNRNTI